MSTQEVGVETDEVETDEGIDTEVETETATSTPTPAPVAARSGKTQTMPTEVIGRMKREARERGKREAMNLLEEQAKAAGFSSLAEAFKTMADARKAPAAVVETQTATPASKIADQRMQRELDRREKTIQETQRKLRLEEKRRKEVQRFADQREVEQSIREQAILAGVQDVDFAVELARREARQIVNSVPPEKVEEALRAFDERKFFADLKGKRPYLFGEKIVPASTGAETDASTAAPPAPTPGKVTDAAAKSDQVDARKLTRDEFQARLQALGLQTDRV